MKLLLLSGENIELAKAEVNSLIRIKFNNRIGVTKHNKFNFKRFAYVNSVFDFLFSCKYSELMNRINEFDFAKYYKKDYAVSIIKFSNNEFCEKKNRFNEKEIAEKIWYRLKKPVVNLRNPKTTFFFIFSENFDKVYCCTNMTQIAKLNDFENRKAHKRPEPKPISLHPKLARCMVNLTGAYEGELIVDPFCGTGGILIEAAFCGFKVRGNDIEEKMIEHSIKNLKHYGLKGNFGVNDYFSSKRKYKYIVTDLPYGKNTKKIDKDFLIKSLNKLKTDSKICVVTIPKNSIKPVEINKLKPKMIFDYYIHKSLTKQILVI